MAIVTIFWFIVPRQISFLGDNLEIMKNEPPLAMINEKLKVKEHENSIPLLQSLPKARTKKNLESIHRLHILSNLSTPYLQPFAAAPKSRWLFWLHPSA